MADAREIKSTAEKTNQLVNGSLEDSRKKPASVLKLDTSVCSFPASVAKTTTSFLSPDCLVGAKTRDLIPSNPDKTASCAALLNTTSTCRASKPKWKPFVSSSSAQEQAKEKTFIFKTYNQVMDSSNQNPKRNDPLKIEQRIQRIAVPKSNPRKLQLLGNPDKLGLHDDSYKLNSESKGLKPAWSKLESVPSKPEHKDQEIHAPQSNPRNIHLLSLSDKLQPHNNSSEMKPESKGLKPAWGKLESVLSKPEQTDQKIYTPISKARNMSSLHNPDMASNNAGLLNHHSEAKECKSVSVLNASAYTSSKTAVPEINSRKIDAASDISLSKGHSDCLQLKPYSGKKKPKWGIFPSVLRSSDFKNAKIDVQEINSGKRDSVFEAGLPKGRLDYLDMQPWSREIKTKWGVCSLSSSIFKHPNKKIDSTKTHPAKIPSLLDIVIPKEYESLRVSTCSKQFKPKRGNFSTTSGEPHKMNQNTKSHPSKMQLLCDSVTTIGPADTFPSWKPFVSTSSQPELAKEKICSFKSYNQKMDSSDQNLKRNGSSKLQQRNQRIAVPKPYTRKIQMPSISENLRHHNDSSKWNPESKEFKPASGKHESGSSKPDKKDQKIDAPESVPRKIQLPSISENLRHHNDSSKLNPVSKEFKPAWGKHESGSSKPGYKDQKIDVPESNPRSLPILYNPEMPSSDADLLKIRSRAKQCKSASVLSRSECREGKTADPEIHSRNTDAAHDVDLPAGHSDSLSLKTSTGRKKTKWRIFSPVLRTARYTNDTVDVQKRNSGKRDSVWETYAPKVRLDSFDRNPCTKEMKTKQENCSSVSNTFKHANEKIEGMKRSSGKIPSLLDIVIPKEYADSWKLNTCSRQHKPKGSNCPAASSEPQKRNHKLTALEPHPGKMTVLCSPLQTSGHADRFKLNSEGKDFKPPQGHRFTVSSKAENGNHKQKTGINKQTMVPTSCYIKSASYADVLKRNIKITDPQLKCKQIPVSSRDNRNYETKKAKSRDGESHCKPTDNTDPKKSANIKMTYEASSLPQSQTSQEQKPQQSRMTRILEHIPFRLHIVDTNSTHHDNTVINDNSFQHGGDLTQNSNHDALLPEKLCELDSDEGPVTPELYKSKDDIFVWEWPVFPIPRSAITGEIIDDGTRPRFERRPTWSDPLPPLEMTRSQFVNMVNHNFKETVITGTETCMDEESSATTRIPADSQAMPLTKDQTVQPSRHSQWPLMDVASLFGDVTRFRQ